MVTATGTQQSRPPLTENLPTAQSLRDRLSACLSESRFLRRLIRIRSEIDQDAAERREILSHAS
jgi:hypothetical protein